MATLDYSRYVDYDFVVEVDSLFNGSTTVSRDDSAAVDFSGKTIKMDIFENLSSTALVTLTSGTEITISTATLTFNKTFTELNVRSYDYELYNDTDAVSIAKGKFIAK